jgi:hypothetical protein
LPLENTQSGVFGPKPALASRITGEYLSVIGTWTYAGSNPSPNASLYRALHQPFPAPEFLELTFDDKGTGEFRGDYRTGFAVNDSLATVPRVKFKFVGDAEVGQLNWDACNGATGTMRIVLLNQNSMHAFWTVSDQSKEGRGTFSGIATLIRRV